MSEAWRGETTVAEVATFATLLRRYRLAASLSQEALAERARLSTATIAALERGRRTAPRPDTVTLLADALELAPHERAALVAAAAAAASVSVPEPKATTSVPVEPHGAPASAPPPLAPLPAPPTALIGREREEAAVMHLLQPDGGARLVILTGPGGVGKTRLALAVAAALRDAYPDDVAFVDLSAQRDPALVAATVSRALGLREEGALGARELLLAYLRDKGMLLVLDNLEQVVEAAPLVGELVAACPSLVVLATSRVALRVRAEQRFEVPPLAVPGRNHPRVAEVEKYAAVRLFMTCARAACPDFALDAAGMAAVAEICRRLDGVPLAIELAAARTALLPPAPLLARLERRLGVLTGGARDLPARQQTLRATIDWSYALLSEGERALFRRLSVFAGGCTLDAAEAVAAPHGMPAGDGAAGDVVTGMAVLVDHSLLRSATGDIAGSAPDGDEADLADPAGGEPRVRMLETVREFGLEQLAAGGEEAAVRQAHAAYYLALAEEARPRFFGPDQVRWLRLLEREGDNLRAALAYARERGDAEMGVRLVAALWRFWYIWCRLGEGRGWLGEFVALSARADVDASARTDALVGLASIAYAQTDYDQVEVVAEQTVAATRALDDRLNLARSLNNLGGVARYRSDFARAEALFAEGVALARALGDRWTLAVSLHNLADVARLRGAYERAAALTGESLVLARAIEDRWMIAQALLTLGLIARDRGEAAEATALLAEGLAIARGLGHTRDIALALTGLGLVAEARGDLDRAAALCAESLALLRPLGDKIRVADALTALGRVRRAQGDDARAALLHGEGLALFRAVGNRLGVAESLEGLAAVAGQADTMRQRARAERATRLLAAAAAVREVVGSPLAPAEHAARARAVAGLRAALGDARFGEAWAAGLALSPEQAIDEAAGIG